MGTAAGISLTHQLMDRIHKELPQLLLKSVYHHSLAVFVQPKSVALWSFLDGTK
jgi:hypothetical protein